MRQSFKENRTVVGVCNKFEKPFNNKQIWINLKRVLVCTRESWKDSNKFLKSFTKSLIQSWSRFTSLNLVHERIVWFPWHFSKTHDFSMSGQHWLFHHFGNPLNSFFDFIIVWNWGFLKLRIPKDGYFLIGFVNSINHFWHNLEIWT